MKKIAAACAMLMTGCVYAAIPEGYVEKKGTDPDIRTYVNSPKFDSWRNIYFPKPLKLLG